jgi:hypothetical protein
MLSAGSPVLHPDLLGDWPVNQRTVVGLNSDVMAVFDGPRVLFPDGFSRGEHNIRAVYYDQPATFKHSIGVIAGPKADAPLLKFVAVYLRSSLARYFLMIRGWKMLCERNGVHLADVESFPFFSPVGAPEPKAAQAALDSVTTTIDEIATLDPTDQAERYEEVREQLDEAIFSYFGIGDDERALIRETVTLLMPSIRPRSFKSIDTPAQHLANSGDFSIYAHALADALIDWRKRSGGRGRFHVDVAHSDPSRAGPSGFVRIIFEDVQLTGADIDTAANDELVIETLAELRRSGMRPLAAGDFLTLLPDTNIWVDGVLYLVRPLTRRSWTVRQARRDAERIVRDVRARAGNEKASLPA